ncbi:MAG: ABC transporter permease [Actinomycetes bacterium]
MIALLAAELLKLRTLRLPWLLAGVATVCAGVIGGTYAHLARPQDHADLTDVARAPAQLVWFLVIVVAVLASAGEFQHRTSRAALLAAPRRGRLLVAKAAAAAAYGAAVTGLGAVVAVLSGLATTHADGPSLPVGPGSGWAAVVGTVAVGAVWAVVATGLGMLTRSTAVSVAAVLLWKFVGEGLLPVLLRRPGISAWTPAGAAGSLTGLQGHAMPAAAGGGLLLAYAAAVVGVAAAAFLVRDPV